MQQYSAIPNYKIIKKLGEGFSAIVYKVTHKKEPNKPLFLKILKTQHVSNYQKNHILQKIEQLKILNDPRFSCPATFKTTGDTVFITYTYFEGITLNQWYKNQNKLSLNDFYSISYKLAEALIEIHAAGIIHGGIKPNNILINPNTLNICLVDFITFLDVRDVSHFIYDRTFVRNTLAYTSLEQTGRINHRVDLSTDIYSLGIVFYELLSEGLPFFSFDPLELIHFHLAQEPAAINDLNPKIPQMLSKVILKMINKQPEKRYKSASGLLTDLKKCGDEHALKGAVSDFALGRYDYSQRITFISKIVGREAESKIVLDKFKETSEGAFRSIFISGLPGIGKTRLIQELQGEIVKHRGYFTSGKYDFYQKNIPYSALIQSLCNLIRIFLTESDERIDLWKKKILKTLDNKGRIITDVVPELEILLGPQPEVKALPPVEAKNRFNDLLAKFLKTLASEENSLIIFIDDLQWCDSATFDFFEYFFNNYEEYKYILFIGAYRHNEVDSSHHLSKLRENIKENKQPLEEIRLTALEAQYCHEMVSYILDSPPFQTQELSVFITDLSEGNPLFVSEILSYLHNENLLFLDDNLHWKWNLEKIRQSNMPSTVVAMFSSKVKKLPAVTIDTLEYCACMGNVFSPLELSMAKELTLFEIFQTLKLALARGLLMENKDNFQFVHDRVQEAVLNAITPKKRAVIHWNIGIHLLSGIGDNVDLEKLDNIFPIVAHLNLGKQKNLDKSTMYKLSNLNYCAGNKALNSLATESAREYFALAKDILPEDCWEVQYKKTFKIYQRLSKTELMYGNYTESEKLLNKLLDAAKTDLDKAECLAEQTASLSSIGNFIKAIETANRGLNYFNKAIPDDPVLAERKREQLTKDIESKNITVWETIFNMPFTKERKSKIELAFYSELIPDLYMSGLVPQLYLSAVQSTQHCLQGGMDESVIYSFTIMALYLGEKGDFERAFKYEDLAKNLCEKYPNTFGATRGMNGIVWCNMHSRSRPDEIVNYSLKSIACGKNSGDLYNAGLSYGPLMWNLQVQGENFTKIEEYANECLDLSNKYHLYFSVRLAEAMKAGWIEPMKKNYEQVDIDDQIKLWEKDNHIASAGSYYVLRGIVEYYFGNYLRAEYYLSRVNDFLSGLTDNVLKRQWYIFVALNTIRLYKNKIGDKGLDKQQVLSSVNELIKKIENWACLGPLLRPYLVFLYAERASLEENVREIRALYFDAMGLAHKYHYTFLEGFINEIIGESVEENPEIGGRCKEYATCNKKKQDCKRWWTCSKEDLYENSENTRESYAGLFFREALRLYKKCRAERKEALLIEKYANYFEQEKLLYPAQAASESVFALPNIDINYLIKSCLVIPAETEENTLLCSIMNGVLETSGAQNGYLIVEENQELRVRVQGHIQDKNKALIVNKKVEGTKDICLAIVRYVQRTKKIVLLENASEKGKFKDNIEVQNMKLRSVLCLPVVKQKKLIGILYMENRLAEAVFTEERTEMTKLFTYQAAISWENARLIEKMKKTEADLKHHKEHLEETIEARTLQLRKAREELVMAERLATLGRLSGSLSHEIRNPLNVISTSAYYLKSKLGNCDENIKKHVKQIEDEVKNSTIIMESLLSLSGIKELCREKLILVDILKKALTFLELPKPIKIVQNISLNSDVVVRGDEKQVSMVFHNIIKNAVDAMSGDGILTIDLYQEGRDKVKIAFTDTGEGISPENIKNVFDALFTTKLHGFGFGLAICKMIIENHDGIIVARSSRDNGATFEITLPVSVQ